MVALRFVVAPKSRPGEKRRTVLPVGLGAIDGFDSTFLIRAGAANSCVGGWKQGLVKGKNGFDSFPGARLIRLKPLVFSLSWVAEMLR